MNRFPLLLRAAARSIVVVASAGATSAFAGAWIPAGPADGGQAPSYGAVATHALVGGQAMLTAGFVPGIAQIATYFTADGGAHWATNARYGGFGHPFLGGMPTIAYLDDSGRVLRSTDQGRTWAPLTLPPPPLFTSLRLWAVNPVNGSELILAAGAQVSHSIDSGSTWTTDAAPATVSELVVDWSTRTIFASFAPGQPVGRRPLDVPGAWGAGGAGPTHLGAGHAIVIYQNSAGALFRSTDGGVGFTPVAQALGVLDLCDFAFSTAPASRIYALECSSGRMLRSDNDGAGWAVVGSLPVDAIGVSIAVDAANSSKLYVATSRGVLLSDDGGGAYAALARATDAPGVARELVLDAFDSSRQWAYDGVARSPGFVRSVDGGVSFTEVTSTWRIVQGSRDRANTLFGANIPGIHGGDSAFGVSTDGGTTFALRLPGIDAVNNFGPMAYGPAAGQIYLNLSAGRVQTGFVQAFYVSTDDGETWAPRFPPPLSIHGGVRTLAVAPAGPSAIYAGGNAQNPGDAQLFRSTDGAVTWQPVATFPSSLSPFEGAYGNSVVAFAIDPSDRNRLYAGFTYPGYLMRSDDAGATWIRANLGLGTGEITSIVIDPAVPSTLYVSQLGSGVFRSTNRGQTWTALDEGLHDDLALQVVRDPFVAGRLYAATGSGLYRADLGTGVPAGDRRAIEFYHQDFNHYFISADTDEIGGLDAGVFQGWARTGESFRVAEASTTGNEPVCRFFSVGFAPLSTHFYTPYPNECEIVKADPNWLYEKIAFGLALPDPPPTRGCPPNTRALYRLYNNFLDGAPNHRYTTSVATFDVMINMGWIFEGEIQTRVFACVPH